MAAATSAHTTAFDFVYSVTITLQLLG